MTEPDKRAASDRCPSVFEPHPAADGAVSRIRLLGGSIQPAQMQTLAQVSSQYGDGYLEMTGRANIQIRGISDVDSVAAALVDAQLVPSTTHEKIRNIEVSSATGRIGGLADVWPLAADLDNALRADDSLGGLSGRFLFGIDDGRADVLARRPDVCAVLRATATGEIVTDIAVDGVVAGTVAHMATKPGGPRDATAAAISTQLTAVAADLVELAGTTRAWRVRDLPPGLRSELCSRARTRLSLTAPVGPQDHSEQGASPAAPHTPLVGWFEQDDARVLLGAVVQLGRLPARLAEFIAAVGAPIIITPDREILLADLSEATAETVVRVLAPMGLIFDVASPWTLLSCCVGAPGCATSRTAVREDLLRRVASDMPVRHREHWVGCERGCGSPAGPHVRVEAGESGYQHLPR